MAGYREASDTSTGDWVACYETEEEAREEVKENDGATFKFEVKGERYDWYDIIDLRDWTEL